MGKKNRRAITKLTILQDPLVCALDEPKKIGFATGVFDLLHIGHLKYLQKFKKHCDLMIVGVYLDEHMESFKHKSIIPFDERMELVEALKPVDMAVKIEGFDPVRKKKMTENTTVYMIKKLVKEGWNIKYSFHSSEWKPKWEKGRKELSQTLGIENIKIPYYKPRTTTEIINEIIRRES